MKQMAIRFPILLTIAIPLLCAAAPWDCVPADNEIAGWTKGGSCSTVPQIPDTASLYRAIDGAAPVYTACGFTCASYQGYINGAIEMCVEIYDQGVTENAKDLWIRTASGEQIPIDTIGDSARVFVGLFGYFYECIEEQCYIKVSVMSDDPEAVAAGSRMARCIAEKVVTVSVEKPFNSLQSNGETNNKGRIGGCGNGIAFAFTVPLVVRLLNGKKRR
ncbi:MAG: hypothetical protein A2487_04300 [Candidatus Raymondbacteria bacterium RifOxyC12_full_50_8]|uniref:Ig-like domain-containing protein n=1 Tax=Candidatus Raymondbacteria bacterium RIFOXYD12_FULL_49_13 TaxID=1817890 RepID=A0A1F7F7D1_UNCRA|nr:MAG: hypothetical protein A2248_00240 [Candidatus Raymondbacteria bacterium RIFOXYA2_FULL_49_16]OGJ96173.1 MAG: hypothetical protein A2453_05590 [Candidatus Raymondbacteria bacterium RIFOXYC2_FULL_50_21]OGK02427.1 MAG: hypothetical protein A2519_14515 [Candidatus Raymondbacteria bacterium RIFOXYD12_FULL_49_13]OGK07578.1 MAG: hypothetical protein A2487_04300 [Candidatus Raymondbacteria bacterium RifOxyC12_full_50_8]OGP41274.1 MAG: hypothetical protein A2324_16770 [Candidatus Raymondbacteria b